MWPGGNAGACPDSNHTIALNDNAPWQQLAHLPAGSCALSIPPQGPVLLRLAYHDAGAFSTRDGQGGANASIQFELDRPENTGLKRGWNVIQQVGEAAVRFAVSVPCGTWSDSIISVA